MNNSPNLPESTIKKMRETSGYLSPEDLEPGKIYAVMSRFNQSFNLVAFFMGSNNGHAIFIDQRGARLPLNRDNLRNAFDIVEAQESVRQAFENFQEEDPSFFKLLQNRRLLKQE